jgi:hypothetical protein
MWQKACMLWLLSEQAASNVPAVSFKCCLQLACSVDINDLINAMRAVVHQLHVEASTAWMAGAAAGITYEAL